MKLFGKKSKKKDYEVEYYWKLSDLARVLEISKITLWRFLKQKKFAGKVEWRFGENRVPKETADRVLGLKSDPPEDIDAMEYDYPPKWLADKMDISTKTLLRKIKRKGLDKYMRWDGRGRKIPRSICQLLYPYLKLGKE